MLVIVRHQMAEELQEYLEKLANDFKDLEIIIAGNPMLLSSVKINKPIRLMNSFDEFVKEL
jgi:hypothetical protein